MKILSNHISSATPEAHAAHTVQKDAPQGPATPAGGGRPAADRICISDGARLLQEALRTAAATADTDVEKVARIRERLQSGTYRPDARRIATGLLGEALTYERLRPKTG